MNVTDELIEMNGLRFHYRDWAPQRPGLPDLVLLHGYTGHARSWDALAARMTDRYRVLALDQRGHGETGWAPPDRYGTDDMVEDLRAFVAALRLRSFALLGLSMGGVVSFRYAGAQPAELSRLVIVDIAPRTESGGMQRIQTGARSNDRFSSREEAFSAARAANSIAPENELRHRVFNNLMRLADGQWTFRYDRALRDPAVPRVRLPEEIGWQSVARIQVPTLIVRGAQSDLLSPEIAQRMQGSIAGSQLVEVPNAGHSVPLDNPEGFASAVRAFLR